ncbi:hypothetical protein MD535_13245 [Vibrio sp. ZSDZ65]|uniref:Uncharacterized protein n=1 Tax=Vibrio qingdaonensis TaxID=2829491 RepID=A0A9X3CP13_9VIBR|nr:hypothetical protein [Vibrio qingdaonensis]MCW8346964.1 hypothetical protein [Vibrio qingdaonensis]
MRQCEINVYDVRDEQDTIVLNIQFSDTTKADFLWSNMPSSPRHDYISHLVVSGNVVAKKYITEEDLSEMNRTEKQRLLMTS